MLASFIELALRTPFHRLSMKPLQPEVSKQFQSSTSFRREMLPPFIELGLRTPFHRLSMKPLQPEVQKQCRKVQNFQTFLAAGVSLRLNKDGARNVRMAVPMKGMKKETETAPR